MTIEELKQRYEVLATIDLAQWTDNYESSAAELRNQLRAVYKQEYQVNQRIVFTHNRDYYVKDQPEAGIILKNLQIALNEEDISNFFAVVVSTNPHIAREMEYLKVQSTDPVPVEYYYNPGAWDSKELARHPYSRKEEYQYGSANPVKIKLNDVSDRHRFLLSESQSFCIYPWIHMHAWPTGEAYPCCHATHHPRYGNTRNNTLKEIWNDKPMRQLRRDMLAEIPNETCAKCHEQESHGFFSGRQSANKHHGHHIHKVDKTTATGELEDFEMTYWDIRFSNLCNLRCRSCGYIFSSQWYQDQAKLAGGDWKNNHKPLNYAGKTETDMWEQLIPHLDYVEQIYFAGGEPLLMEEHYNILEELIKRKKTHVRLIYNTNFTHTDLKGKSVFEYWNQFDSVAVGASLDAEGPRGEYIRKGTDWNTVINNRKEMIKTCPNVDFYISATLSILNAHHLPEFHRNWVEAGLINAQDFNVNILQDPAYYRIDIANKLIRDELTELWGDHVAWLKTRDLLRRATVGFEAAITFINGADNSDLIPKFWAKTQELDNLRGENVLDVCPELKYLK